MKRYVFSLAGVLRLRVQQAEAAEAKLALLYTELQTIQTRQQEFEDQLQKDQAELFTPNRVLAGESLVQMDSYCRWAAMWPPNASPGSRNRTPASSKPNEINNFSKDSGTAPANAGNSIARARNRL